MENEIALSLSRNYVAHWSWKEAIRELIQNALDCDDHRITTYFDGSLVIATGDGAISRTALLLGESGKKDGDKIGHFGEGLKLALLILAREEYNVTVKSGKDIWIPSLKFSEQFQTECLHIGIETDESAPESEVVIKVTGLDREQLEFVDNMYIHQSLNELAVVQHEGNRVYEPKDLMGDGFEPDHDEAVPKVFVGGLYVCDLPEGYHYSYDLRPNRITLDRDRRTVGDWDMAWEVSRLLTEAGRADLLVKLSEMDADDVKGYTETHRSYSSYGSSSRVDSQNFDQRLKELASQSFLDRNGPKAIPVNMNMEQGKRRLYNLAITRAGYHPVLIKPAEFAMIGDGIKLPDDVTIISKPDVLKELEAILDQYKIAPAPRGKIKALVERIKEFEEFSK